MNPEVRTKEPFLRRHFTTIAEILLIVGFEYMVPPSFLIGLALWLLVPILFLLNEYFVEVKLSEAVAVFGLAIVPALLVYRMFYVPSATHVDYKALRTQWIEQMKTLPTSSGQDYTNTSISLDGRRFEDCVIGNGTTTLSYQGDRPFVFNCTIKQGEKAQILIFSDNPAIEEVMGLNTRLNAGAVAAPGCIAPESLGPH
jgi:hypothetical protein